MKPFTVAIMQPYFIPYAGYFRMFAASDLFVIYDCVQFPRRGWVHRNRLPDRHGVERWLTLPLERAPQSVRICDLRFPPGVADLFAARLRPFPLAAQGSAEPILRAVREIGGSPVNYIVGLLERLTGYLGLPWQTIRSTTLSVPASIRGQERILEIATRLGARRYLNAPGGRDLYDPNVFAEAGIELAFLPDHSGPVASILPRVLREDRDELASEIRRSATSLGSATQPVSA